MKVKKNIPVPVVRSDEGYAANSEVCCYAG